MSEAHPLNLPLALGCVEYEMHVLAMALLMRRDGSPSDGRFPEAVSELVASALLVKARSLVEFLTRRPNAKGITLENFGIPRRNDPVLKEFYGFVCNHSVHLDRKRASDPLVLRATKYHEALYVLRECANACNEIREKGVRLSAKRHRERHEVLRAQLTLLGIELT
jgi:hypothetical protein